MSGSDFEMSEWIQRCIEKAVAAERARIRQQLENLPRYKGVGVRGFMVPANARGIYDPATDSKFSDEGEWVEYAALQQLFEG